MATSPITIGELNDVPQPESPVNAQFHQEVANRIVHRFANVGAMNAWAAANGSLAYVAPTHYARIAGAWQPFTYQANLDAAVANATNANNATNARIDGVIPTVPKYAGGKVNLAPFEQRDINTGINFNLVVAILGVTLWRQQAVGSEQQITFFNNPTLVVGSPNLIMRISAGPGDHELWWGVIYDPL